MSIEAVIFDVGGTLWPDSWPRSGKDDEYRIARLAQVFKSLEPKSVRTLYEYLLEEEPRRALWRRQPTRSIIRASLRRIGRTLRESDRDAVRGAMLLPASGRIQLFPGVIKVLQSLARRGLSVGLLTNATWRTGDDYLRDFAALGASGLISFAVSSVDVGWRKPHPIAFAAALARAQVDPASCVFVGNSERNDMDPARRLGMTTILVQSEPTKQSTVAHASVTTMPEVIPLLHVLGTAV